MKKLISIVLIIMAGKVFAQDKTIKLSDLAVPTSPAFIITDVTPTLVQSPNTPKSFVLGVAQSYQQSGTGFPNNYSAEFTPYWWFKAKGRDVYGLLGIKTTKDASQHVVNIVGENPFSGLKFTSLSTAFINKDLIPDTSSVTQKIFSIGVRTTIIKIHAKGYVDSLKSKINQWHSAAQSEIDANAVLQAAIARHPEQTEQLIAQYKEILTGGLLGDINTLINQKPLFSWDVAAAYSVYGINDDQWMTGRTGIWTTFSTYLPLDLGTSKPNTNYLNLNLICRYLSDNFQTNEQGNIGYNNDFDIGGKAGLEFDQLSIGIESLYRYVKGVSSTQNRTVGIINYKVATNIYLNGTFGKNFDVPDKLVTAFGINWGFGKEEASLPE